MNDRVAGGSAHAGDRHITVHLLAPRQPIKIDYLYFRHKNEMQPVIEAGREDTRHYLDSIAV